MTDLRATDLRATVVRGTELPSPAIVVLVGASGAGKTTWARARFASNEIVSSDALRAVVGSGEGDLDASVDAFAVLDAIVAARARRGLTTVIDTLGLDEKRRRAAVELARASGMPAVAVRFVTDAATCRRRNRARDRPVPAPALTAQLRRAAALDLSSDGFDAVVIADGEVADAAAVPTAPGVPAALAVPAAPSDPVAPSGPLAADAALASAASEQPSALRFALQISRFPSGSEDLRGWLAGVARAAEEAGFAAVAVMDHLLQIPQVGRVWEPIPEAFTTLGYLAGVTERLQLGALVTPVTFRSAPLLAKIIASLDAVSGGRAFCGLGAGWYDREHRAYDLPFPPDGARLDRLEATIGTLRAFWGAGTKPYGGLPETTCYPRPSHPIPIIVGGGGERRTLDIAARLADGCNVPTAQVERKVEVLRRHCERAGRDPAEVKVTVLDLPIVGRDRDEVAGLVEAHRGNRPATAYAAAHFAGTVADQIARYRTLADRGVSTAFVSLPDLTGPAQLERFQPIVAALACG